MKTKDMNQENRKDLLEFELKEEKLQNIEFKPLYNPRLSLGNLDIHSAKCMTSKKVSGSNQIAMNKVTADAHETNNIHCTNWQGDSV